ncbi:MAG: c-type cytochrome [Gemmatimonadetes bacterium]|nr:c-type cytochrome [Gemmatimonadota bacterium]
MRRPLRPLLPALLLAGASACGGTAPDGSASSIAGVAATHGDSLSGRALAAILGCGACHPGAPAPPGGAAGGPPLSGLSERWAPADLASWLADPVPLREGVIARMPDFHLEPAEAAAATMHLLRGAGSRQARAAIARLGEEHAGATAERGAAIVQALNCAGCHAGSGAEAWAPGPPLDGIRDRLRPDWLRSFLAAPRPIRPFGYHPGSGARMPDFRLSRAEADSLASWMYGEELRASAAPAMPRPLSPFASRKAELLLRDHLACLGCHTLGGEGGRIAPALDGAAARLRPDYLRRIVATPGRAAPGSIMPAPLEDSATMELITRYLHGRATTADTDRYLSLVDNVPVRPDRSGQRTPAALYGAYCAPCHGVGGAGDGFNAPHLPARPTPHADSTHMSARPDATLFDGIHGGGHILGRSHRMPGFGATLSTSEIDGLVDYLRLLCACAQPDWAVAP